MNRSARCILSVVVALLSLVALSACVPPPPEPPSYAPPRERPEYRTPEGFFEDGMRDLNRGEFRDAAEDFQQAVRLRPNYVEAYYFMGRAFEGLRNDDEAMRAYSAAISFDSRYLPARESYGLLLFAVKSYREAERQLEAAQSLGSEVPEVYYCLGTIEYRERECNKAIAAFKQALRLNPSYRDAREALEETLEHCRGSRPAPPPRPREEKSFKGGGKAIDPDSF